MNVRLVAITKPTTEGITTASELIGYCARVSNPTNQENIKTMPKLLAYMANHGHWSPFEMAHMVVEIKTTRDVLEQMIRHKSFAFQVFSQRYSVVTSPPVFRGARLQDPKNRQSSIETDDDDLQRWWASRQAAIAEITRETYQEAVERGIAKEVARSVLPEGQTPTTLYMAGPIRSWIHYCQLRCGPETQKEHRLIAEECRLILLREFPTLSEIMNTTEKQDA